MIDFSENIDVLEKMVWNFILNENSDETWLKPVHNNEYLTREELFKKIRSSYFYNQILSDTWKYAYKFYKEYNKIPNRNELYKYLEIHNFDITKDSLFELYNFNFSDYNFDFIYKYLKSFILIRSLNVSMMDILTYLKITKISPDNIDTIIEKVRNEINEKLTINFTSEKAGDGLNFLNPNHHLQTKKTGSPSGYEFFDKTQGGGWNEKTLVVFQGRPKIGKSLVLGNIAVNAFLSNVNVGIVTVELSEDKYMKRVGANILNIPVDEYNSFTNEDALVKVADKLNEFKSSGRSYGELLIKEFPTGSATAIDIENFFIRKEQEMNKKFKVIVVDYLNLLKPIGGGDKNMYEKIKVISEELRGVAMRNKWCIISATQIKRDSVNDYDLGMDSVAESFGLIHTVDALYGLMRNPLDVKMKIKLIANRDNGYEESYKMFEMNKEFLKLTELKGPSNEFYSDDEQVNTLATELKESYEALDHYTSNSSNETKIDNNTNQNSQNGTDYDSILNSI